MSTQAIDWLHRSLSTRETPESVAARVETALGADIPPGTAALIKHVVGGSLQARFAWSSMSRDFAQAVTMDTQIDTARALARDFLARDLPRAAELDDLEAFIGEFSALIGRAPGARSFAGDRLNRAGRRQAGLTLSRRRYDKMFRLASRLEDRLGRLRRATSRRALALIAKSGLAAEIRREDLAELPWTASFLAYYAARMKLRSEFTISGQQKAFDELSAALLSGCAAHEQANWFAIAHIFPREDVLDRLTPAEKGALLGRWYAKLVEIADLLARTHETNRFNLDTMIVKPGDDSSTWNTFAGAWNRARDHWIALVAALGMERMFDALLPGKVMRLMAADVAAWHRRAGGGLHPDTAVWRELPKPWLVLSGASVCTRDMIEGACTRHGVDPRQSGWSAPRPRTAVAVFRPTPELVHGVSVENPYLADMLRRLGAYSGKPLSADAIAKIVGPS
jgi:hypothetical protein